MRRSPFVLLLTVFLLSSLISAPFLYADSKTVIRGIIEPIVIPEMGSMQLTETSFQSSSYKVAGAKPSFETNASKKDLFSQTIVEHIDGVTVYTFVAL